MTRASPAIPREAEEGCEVSISPDQARNARRLLGWPVTVVAGKSGLSTSTVLYFEKGTRRPRISNIAKIRKVLEVGGVEFVGETGARLKSP
jgi:transcriptional regulator with XRE-family HTH domain